MTKLPKPIVEALDATGLPWAAEHGTRHTKIKLAGRLVGVAARKPISDCDLRPTKNIVSQIRRAARQSAAA